MAHESRLKRLIRTGIMIGAAAIIMVICIALILLIQTFAIGGVSLSSANMRVSAPAIDSIERFSAAIRFKTISANADRHLAEIESFRGFLQEAYANVSDELEYDLVGEGSILLTWRGSDSSLRPILLAAHFDVVPVAPWTETQWEHPPFEGIAADGFIWGRGAWDNKFSVISILEATEALLRSGHQPNRTIYLAFGHDEETGGTGAQAIAAKLASQGVMLDWVLDEGSTGGMDLVPGALKPTAIVGVSEKGSAMVQLSAVAAGGHSAMPTPENSVFQMSRAMARVSENPFPERLSEPVSEMFDRLAPAMEFETKLALANRWAFEGVLLDALSATPSGNATIRTTIAPTRYAAGVADNVLAPEASVLLNLRLLPGDTLDDVRDHLERAVNDPNVAIEVDTARSSEATPVSKMSGPAWDTIAASISRVFPDVVVTPGLTIGGTDGRHYTGVAENVYRFQPIRIWREDLPRIHGTNERVSVEDFGAAIEFYIDLIASASSPANAD